MRVSFAAKAVMAEIIAVIGLLIDRAMRIPNAPAKKIAARAAISGTYETLIRSLVEGSGSERARAGRSFLTSTLLALHEEQVGADGIGLRLSSALAWGFGVGLCG
jgi:hypothetical protein